MIFSSLISRFRLQQGVSSLESSIIAVCLLALIIPFHRTASGISSPLSSVSVALHGKEVLIAFTTSRQSQAGLPMDGGGTDGASGVPPEIVNNRVCEVTSSNYYLAQIACARLKLGGELTPLVENGVTVPGCYLCGDSSTTDESSITNVAGDW